MTEFDTDALLVYPAFIKYFGDLHMTKVKEVDAFSCYVAHIHATLGFKKRYIIAMCYRDRSPIGFATNLSSIYWTSLQLRELDTEYKIPEQSYVPRYTAELNHTIIKRPEVGGYEYDCPNIPSILITMLQTEKKEMYVDRANLLSAIEDYKTVITFK